MASTMLARSSAYYLDALGESHGLVLSKGNFTTVDVPGATSTSIKGINHAGEMVGWYSDAAGNVRMASC